VIPYFPQPSFRLGPFHWYAFQPLVVLAIVGGYWGVVLRADRLGLDRARASRFCLWILICGFLFGHWVKLLLPDPSRALERWWLLLWPFAGQASFGGLLGGMIGVLGWTCRERISGRQLWRWLDVLAFVWPFALGIGRFACTLAHDHRGVWTDHWLAIRYPEGTRFNLGLIEFLFLIALSAAFLALDRRPRPVGLFFCTYGIVYGAFRLWLDTLHHAPPRLFGPTLDQIGGGITLLVGLAALALTLSISRGGGIASPRPA